MFYKALDNGKLSNLHKNNTRSNKNGRSKLNSELNNLFCFNFPGDRLYGDEYIFYSSCSGTNDL